MAKTFNIELARKFLRRNYDPALDLFREAPVVARDRYWIYNDHYLVCLALDCYFAQVDTPPSRPVVLTGEVHDVLLPVKVEDVGVLGEKLIKTEVLDPEGSPLDPAHYADIAFFQAMSLANQGLMKEAVRVFQQGEATWAGVGFLDQATKESSVFATYKLALYLITAQRLAVQPKYLSRCVSLIASSQYLGPNLSQYGGCLTDYRGTVFGGDANTETTALCILAMENV